MKFVWDHYVPHEIDRLHPLAAPLRADLRNLPPVVLVLPEMDVLRSEGDAMAAKLAAAEVCAIRICAVNSDAAEARRLARHSGQNPPEIAYWERGEWWLAGDARPWQPAAVSGLNILSTHVGATPAASETRVMISPLLAMHTT